MMYSKQSTHFVQAFFAAGGRGSEVGDRRTYVAADFKSVTLGAPLLAAHLYDTRNELSER